MTNEELKPCPFCGGEAYFVASGWKPGWFDIDHDAGVGCPLGEGLDIIWDNKPEARDVWNTRTPTDAKENGRG